MDRDTIIEIQNVSMKYNLSKDRVDSFKEYMIRLVKRQLFYNEFQALAQRPGCTEGPGSAGLQRRNAVRSRRQWCREIHTIKTCCRSVKTNDGKFICKRNHSAID